MTLSVRPFSVFNCVDGVLASGFLESALGEENVVGIVFDVKDGHSRH